MSRPKTMLINMINRDGEIKKELSLTVYHQSSKLSLGMTPSETILWRRIAPMMRHFGRYFDWDDPDKDMPSAYQQFVMDGNYFTIEIVGEKKPRIILFLEQLEQINF